MELVVVESPTKAKTLSKFLGKGYEVTASYGHVRDLPKSKLGVDVENNFEPQYLIPVKAKPVVKLLKEAAGRANNIWLSSDPDREGEAIAWHIAQVLGPGKVQKSKIKNQSGSNFKRAVFHEITESAVKEAFASPRDLDMNLVNSQQARRILDRIVGYKLSPLLWKKVARNLSAGRVQSVAVRLIVERERERTAFIPKEYWSITAGFFSRAKIPDLYPSDPGSWFEAQLIENFGKKIEIKNEIEAKSIEAELKNSNFEVKEIKKEEKHRYPSPPFTTSTLQQTAGNKLGFSASRTMKAAQSLYENGLITYMRTDSVNLSQQFLDAAQSHIKKEFGPAFCPEKPIHYKTKSRLAQEAHEAIRPTAVGQISNLKSQISNPDEWKLYELIWKRAVASQMTPAVFDATTIDIVTNNLQPACAGRPTTHNYLLRASGSTIKFEGWLKLYGAKDLEDEAGKSKQLPPLTVNEKLDLKELRSEQHFTEARARFTEATLVKALEEEGIGRPSTYAPIISTIQKRGYVGHEGRYLFPLDIGLVVNDLLVVNFPKIVDLSFTSRLEGELDLVAEGKEDWVSLVKEFYGPFEKLVVEKETELKKEDFTTLQKLDEKCPDCGKDLIVKIGKFGKFVSCLGFPDCKFTKPLNSDGAEEVVDQEQLGKCPNDGGELTIKRGRFGQFVACLNYPNCKFTKPYLQKTGDKCPECQKGDVVAKKTGKGKNFFGCSRYPECKYASWTKPASPAGGPGEPAKTVVESESK